jgi:hypothetical protein
MQSLDPEVWYTERRFRWLATSFMVLAGCAAAALGIFKTDNDFLWHRQVGEKFLNGELYRERTLHYLPARPLWNSATVWLPYRVDRAIYMALALAALAAIFVFWNRLAERAKPIGPRTYFAACALTVAALASYLLRDLSECGLQIILLFFLSAAALALYQGRRLLGGFCLATAIAYKVTPLLFLPYLLWKRQWRATGWTVLFLLGWCVAPAIVLGWQANLDTHVKWLEFTRGCLALEDPLENGVEPPNPRNQSLPFAVACFVESYPPGHPHYLEDKRFIQFGDLDPLPAKRVVQATLFVLALFLAWHFRQPLSSTGAEQFTKEWAVLTASAALLSPLCWLQHLVLMLPAVFLWVRWVLVVDKVPRWHLAFAGVAVAIMLVLHKDTLGRPLFLLVMSYKFHTLAAVMLLILMGCSRSNAYAPRGGGVCDPLQAG